MSHPANSHGPFTCRIPWEITATRPRGPRMERLAPKQGAGRASCNPRAHPANSATRAVTAPASLLEGRGEQAGCWPGLQAGRGCADADPVRFSDPASSNLGGCVTSICALATPTFFNCGHGPPAANSRPHRTRRTSGHAMAIENPAAPGPAFHVARPRGSPVFRLSGQTCPREHATRAARKPRRSRRVLSRRLARRAGPGPCPFLAFFSRIWTFSSGLLAAAAGPGKGAVRRQRVLQNRTSQVP